MNSMYTTYERSARKVENPQISLLGLGRVPRPPTYGEGSHNIRGKNDSSGTR